MYSVQSPCLYMLSLCLKAHLSERPGNAEHTRSGPCFSNRTAERVSQESHH